MSSSPSTTLSDSAKIPISLGRQFRRHLPSYGAGLVLLAAYQAAQYWFDTRLMRAFDGAIAGDVAQAGLLGGLLILVAVAAFGIRVLSRMTVFNAGRRAEYELRRALLFRLQLLGPAFYGRMSTGEIMSRMTSDLQQVRALLGFGVLNVINTLFALISALSVTLSISVKLTLASLASLPLLMLVTRAFSSRIYTRNRANQDAIGQLSSEVQSSIAGVRVVRSFSLEKAEMARFQEKNQRYLEKSLALARLRGSFGPIMQAITAIGVVIVFWYGGHLILVKELTPGGFLAFYRALARLTWPLIALGFLVALVQRGRASYARLAEVFDAVPGIGDGPLPAPETTRGELEVRDLSFSYDEQPVLKGVSFRLPEGGSLAVVGKTGAGKSTLAVLLPRLQPGPRGSIFLDGTDVCDLPLAHVRSVIGYAQQDAFLFSTTVGRNIGYCLEDPDGADAHEIVRRAAEEAQVLREIEELPDGFDTVVGERGVQLSGGQKQRVALARALVSKPRILVLDDPLSAVDGRTEKAILEAIDRQLKQRSVILITHRVSAAARCDQVVVLDEGRVVQSGTHEELLEQPGLYSAFAEEQRIEGELARLGSEDGSDLVAGSAAQ